MTEGKKMRNISFFTILFIAACAYAGAEQAVEKTGAPPAGMPPIFTPIKTDATGTAAPAPGRPAPFTAEMSAEFMRKVMETSAKIEAIKKQMADRRDELFDSHQEIKSLRAEMVSLQDKINGILARDQELSKMEMERDIIWTTMPPMPGARMRPGAGAPMGLFPMMNTPPPPASRQH